METTQLKIRPRLPVFVYGTLRKGLSNHSVLNDPGAEFLCAGFTRGRMYSLGVGAFPGVVFNDDSGIIWGEIYLVNRRVLGTIDTLEGYLPQTVERSFYVRRKIYVWPNDPYNTHSLPGRMKCYAYEILAFTPFEDRVIRSGDFKQFVFGQEED